MSDQIESPAKGRLGRAWPGHPRATWQSGCGCSWMPGPRPGTNEGMWSHLNGSRS